MKQSDLVALVDLDGTLADYDSAMTEAMRSVQDPSEAPYGSRYEPDGTRKEIPHVEARRRLIQRQPGFWRGLKPLALGFDVVKELRSLGFELHVLTKGPALVFSAWSEKVEWSQTHISDAVVTITGEKSLVYGRVLVDDYPPYFEKWLNVRPRGLVVCVAQSWNEHFGRGGRSEHPNVVRYDGTNLDIVKERLSAAYSRASHSG